MRRISLLPRRGNEPDPDYVDASVWKRTRIFLDGVLQPHWLTADEEAGEVDRFILNERGTPLVVDGTAQTETKRGRVRIAVLPPPMEESFPAGSTVRPMLHVERMQILTGLIDLHFPGEGYVLLMCDPETPKRVDYVTNGTREEAIEILEHVVEQLCAAHEAGEPEPKIFPDPDPYGLANAEEEPGGEPAPALPPAAPDEPGPEAPHA